MSKNVNNKNKDKTGKDFNSWIKVLRPKVYITDSSSFKSLVQELTGNGSSSSSPIITSPPPMKLQVADKIQDDYYHQVEPESSTDVTVDVSVDDSSDDQYLYSNHQVLLTADHDHQDHYDDHQVYNQTISLEDTGLEDWTASQIQEVDLLDYGSLESWLVDFDHLQHHPYFLSNGYVNQIIEQPEVSIYDYELPGLL
ncbi:hypothetical protein FNV43_RR14691 [Rhamnella rubrinervis]|uniref:VQ domain-containing protein n=1 Tax=Rhamnella rubrinervis TaxID=2594499 RepID=A0A8K0MGN7_9ROSA|nr:hypothetical protein FNV43_RR14691 [Rhamnella rubrinervis]